MEFSLICTLQILLFIQISNTQYPPYYQAGMNQPYYANDGMDYANMGFQPRSYRRPYGSSGGKLPLVGESTESDYSEECDPGKCRCDQCDYPRPCCVELCNSCQSNLLFVPYPYPVVVASTLNVTTTEEPTTTTTTQTTLLQELVTQSSTPFETIDSHTKQRKNGDSEYILTSLRRTKTNYPKFGIVPIPNLLAESLMSQMRSMKGINSRKDRDERN